MFCLSNKEEFQCRPNECVKWSFVCDGVAHCSNQADEDCGMYLQQKKKRKLINLIKLREKKKEIFFSAAKTNGYM